MLKNITFKHEKLILTWFKFTAIFLPIQVFTSFAACQKKETFLQYILHSVQRPWCAYRLVRK